MSYFFYIISRFYNYFKIIFDNEKKIEANLFTFRFYNHFKIIFDNKKKIKANSLTCNGQSV